MGDLFSDERKVPITEHPLPSGAEIERDIREIIQNYEGEELVRKLTGYCALSLMETLLTKDPKPQPLWRLGDDRLNILGRLSSGLDSPPPPSKAD